ATDARGTEEEVGTGMLTEWQARHQREYETIFILDPRVTREQAERVVQRVSEAMAAKDARLLKVDYWGRRKLSYRLRRNDWGFYYLLRFLGTGAVVAELERNFRMLDAVLRHQTILVRSDVDGTGLQVGAGDVEFRIDQLAKEAAEAVREQPPDAVVAAPAPLADDAGEVEDEDDDDDDDDDAGGDDVPEAAADGAGSDDGAAKADGEEDPADGDERGEGGAS
ncbi:MAG: 30S ribosomal protein S6, partial [Myxococcota bacterium]|nr:30S ribosomal protein S6 [Myxococcota bacterium]